MQQPSRHARPPPQASPPKQVQWLSAQKWPEAPQFPAVQQSPFTHAPLQRTLPAPQPRFLRRLRRRLRPRLAASAASRTGTKAAPPNEAATAAKARRGQAAGEGVEAVRVHGARPFTPQAHEPQASYTPRDRAATRQPRGLARRAGRVRRPIREGRHAAPHRPLPPRPGRRRPPVGPTVGARAAGSSMPNGAFRAAAGVSFVELRVRLQHAEGVPGGGAARKRSPQWASDRATLGRVRNHRTVGPSISRRAGRAAGCPVGRRHGAGETADPALTPLAGQRQVQHRVVVIPLPPPATRRTVRARVRAPAIISGANETMRTAR